MSDGRCTHAAPDAACGRIVTRPPRAPLAFDALAAYRRRVTADDVKTCALCDDPIEPGHAWLAADDGRVAHSGCVYADDDVPARDHWMAPDLIG
jgi:hypothetical protein